MTSLEKITLFSKSRDFPIDDVTGENHTFFQNHAFFPKMTSLEKFTYFSKIRTFLNLYNFQDIGYDFICVLLLFSTRCLWKTIKNILRRG